MIFTTPDMYFYLFHSPADGNGNPTITSHLGLSMSKHPDHFNEVHAARQIALSELFEIGYISFSF